MCAFVVKYKVCHAWEVLMAYATEGCFSQNQLFAKGMSGIDTAMMFRPPSYDLKKTTTGMHPIIHH